ncbi:MAG TPA: DUF6049 family protein [Acidimicrobiales bacterium]|nr:DUF6049 family protein [Acidimicrobiales bacterium]
MSTRTLLALGAVVLAGVLGLAPPVGAQSTPSGRVSLASQTPWVSEGSTFRLRVDIAGVRRPDAVEVAVTVHEAVTSRSQFQRTLEGRLLGAVLHSVPVEPLTAVQLDAAGAIRFDLPLAGPGPAAEPSDVVLPGAGVYPVRVALREAGTGTVIDEFTTHLVREPDDNAEPLAVAWVQPFGAPPALRPDGTVELDDDRVARLATLAGALATSDMAFTLAPRPETLDALSTEATDTLVAVGEATAGRQVVAGPYANVDVTSLLRAGLVDELRSQREMGAATVEHHLGVSADRATWISERPLTDTAIDALTGVEQLVLPEDAFTPLDRPLTLANPFLVEGAGGDPVEAVVADDGLVAHLTGAGDPVLRAHHLLADLAVLAYDAPGLERGVVVQPPSGWSPSPDFLAAALDGLGRGSVVEAVTLDTLFREVPMASSNGIALVRELSASPSEPLDMDTDRLDQLRRDMASLGAVTEGAQALRPDLAERLLLVAQDRSLGPEQRDDYLDGARRSIAERLTTVTILSQGSFRLTSREATIPLTLVNNVDAEMRVSLLLQSEKLDFVGPDGSTTGTAAMPLTLAPGNNPVVVPVEARTSGEFPLLISVNSPDGALSLATARLTVRSTFLSGMGVGLSAGAGLFLAVWWASHWRSARRDRRLVPSPG